MNKRHSVCHLLFAGMMSVGLGQEHAISSAHVTATTSAQTVRMQIHQAQHSNETPISDSGSASNVEGGSHSSQSTGDSVLFGGDSCRPEEIETRPCQ